MTGWDYCKYMMIISWEKEKGLQGVRYFEIVVSEPIKNNKEKLIKKFYMTSSLATTYIGTMAMP